MVYVHVLFVTKFYTLIPSYDLVNCTMCHPLPDVVALAAASDILALEDSWLFTNAVLCAFSNARRAQDLRGNSFDHIFDSFAKTHLFFCHW